MPDIGIDHIYKILHEDPEDQSSQGLSAMLDKCCFWIYLFLGVILALGLTSEPEQDSPVLESSHVEINYSEQGITKYKLSTDKVLHYASGDRIYPEGMQITLYAPNKEITLVGRANYVYFFARYNVYAFKGDVAVTNFQDKKQLNTEELYWNTEQETVYTDKYVKIETAAEEILTGTGLTAKQDLSYYTIFKLQGQLQVSSDQ